MITNDILQSMITNTNRNPEQAAELLDLITNDRDRGAITVVLSDGYYEAFDRYDSDVAEQFITAYRKVFDSVI